ncbi:nuclear RNA export factor 2-like isoform X2 [Trichoplusia ni]|nr:nuclear RNA export factor 2-like isoform X2 [Trichoplusia ni]XP_026730134.1 nuclear RNA export factor 2-like isoform X2 [Trichoplusia ni]
MCQPRKKNTKRKVFPLPNSIKKRIERNKKLLERRQALKEAKKAAKKALKAEAASKKASSEATPATEATSQVSETQETTPVMADPNQQHVEPVPIVADTPQVPVVTPVVAPIVHQVVQVHPTVPTQNKPMYLKQQHNQQKRRKRGEYEYNYPKGIPRSFIIQQKLCQEAGIQQSMTNSPIYPMGQPKIPNHQMYQHMANTVQATFDHSSTMTIVNDATGPISVNTDFTTDVQQPYSPSDIYSESGNLEPAEEDELSDTNQTGQKRLSAFQRLGPLSQPKKPKLTINLTLHKEQPVREVVDDTDVDLERYTPVHLRQNIINSTDETVKKYLPHWPWKKNVGILGKRSATARASKSVMIIEQELMEEAYEKENLFINISVKGYPASWTKERVLDAILDSVKDYSLIPCFTEFYENECKFLVLRNRSALIILHKTGFYIHKDGVELTITIAPANLTLNQIDFIPRIILRQRIAMGYDGVKHTLNLSSFTLQEDISHFIYFPLSRVSNQSELIQLQSVIAWDSLTTLDLSHNRLSNLSGLDLISTTPKLEHLNLSHNYLAKVTALLVFRDLPLKSINLEGNPLCHDYIQTDHYIKVLKMMFPALVEIDGVKILLKGDLPDSKRIYCPEDAMQVAEKFLETFFPLLDCASEQRFLIEGMYADNAALTVTYCYKLRYGPIYRNFRNLFLYARFLDEGETDSVVGAMAITRLINRWPRTEHDPSTFVVDVMFHSERTTILRMTGILKLTAESLAEDEHLLTFSRTVVLHSRDGYEYKILNEMVYWSEPTASQARAAFRVTSVSQKNTTLKIDSTTDEDLQEKLLKVFMKLTTMDKKTSKRCLEINSWNFKLALEHFTKLWKDNNLNSLTKEIYTV